MPIMKCAALYARVSTRNGHQDPETQLLALRQVAERAGWQAVEEYVDRGISGAKGRDQQPAFDRLMKDHAPPVRCDHGVERRPPRAIVAGPCGLLGRGARSRRRSIPGPAGRRHDHARGKALFQMMGVFAEFERAMICERVCAGLDKAGAKGKRLGRPKVAPDIENSIRAARAAGKGQLAIAHDLGVGVSTVRRVLGIGAGT
jgi:DNA invertase Pin-like site-specific DNA recombinase